MLDGDLPAITVDVGVIDLCLEFDLNLVSFDPTYGRQGLEKGLPEEL
jgi:hypothetical protein